MIEQREPPQEPLSAERIEEIRESMHGVVRSLTAGCDAAVLDLLAEVDRLRAENVRLRAELAARDAPAEARQHYEDIAGYIASFSPEERAALEQADADMEIILDLQEQLDKALEIVRAVAGQGGNALHMRQQARALLADSGGPA